MIQTGHVVDNSAWTCPEAHQMARPGTGLDPSCQNRVLIPDPKMNMAQLPETLDIQAI
jgi:hypothetical protein